MTLAIFLVILAILFCTSGFIGALRSYRKVSVLSSIEQPPPAGAATEPPAAEPARSLWPESDELEAARWRSKRFRKEQKSPHPMQEPFRKALERFAAEWGFDLNSAEHHVYDYSDHDQHVVFIRMETRTARERRFS